MPAHVNDLIGLGLPPNQALYIGHISNAGNPTSSVTPAYIGQVCHDTSNDDWYISHGVANTEWKITAT